MNRSSCAKKIQEGLERLSDVRDISVSAKTLAVSVESGKPPIGEIEDCVRCLGYEVAHQSEGGISPEYRRSVAPEGRHRFSRSTFKRLALAGLQHGRSVHLSSVFASGPADGTRLSIV